MIIGIMGAMPDEVDQLCARLENVTVEPYGGVEYHKGTLAGKQVVVCCAGMGKANAAATTQVLITRFGAEKIIFSGIAGNMTSKIGIGDVVIGKTVLYHDAQLDMICQNPPFLKEYTGDPALIAAAEAACAAHAVRIYACMTEPVVLTLFIGVRQNAVGFIDFLEFFFGFLVAGVLVGVILHGHLTKGLFDLLLACPFLQAKHFIVIAFFCHNKSLS